METLRMGMMQLQGEEQKTTNSIIGSSGSSSPGSRILKGTSQNPHFGPLRSFSGVARKNLITGWDQTYEDTVNRVQDLQSDNFWANVDDLWKTVEELEGMGYNVAQMRKRLDELTDVMKKSKSSCSKVSNLKMRIEAHKKEKMKLESEICKMQAKAVQEQLTIDELTDQIGKQELNLPVLDGLFASLAMAPM